MGYTAVNAELVLFPVLWDWAAACSQFRQQHLKPKKLYHSSKKLAWFCMVSPFYRQQWNLRYHFQANWKFTTCISKSAGSFLQLYFIITLLIKKV